MEVHRNPGEVAFVLKEKMKSLNEILRKWKKEVFGILNLEMEDVMRSLNDLDKVAASSDQEVMEDEELAKSRALASKKVYHFMNYRESMLSKNLRLTWIKEGDNNSNFFHNSMKMRYRRNCLVGLVIPQNLPDLLYKFHLIHDPITHAFSVPSP